MGRPRQAPRRGKERHLWQILLLLSLCANAFFLLSVHTYWLGPGLQVFAPRSPRDLAGGQDDVRAVTSQRVSASRNNETKEALLVAKAVVGKNSSSGVQGVSGESKRTSVVLSKKGGGSELHLKRAEKSALGINQRALKKNKDPVLLTNQSSSYVTNADLCLPPFWTTNPNATERLEDVMKTVQDFPPEDFAAVQINASFFVARRNVVNNFFPRILLHASRCPDTGPFLLLVVPSIDFHRRERTAIRKTWASPVYGEAWPGDSRNFTTVVKLVFFFGTSHRSYSLMEESQQYGDVVVADFVESYQNLSLKMAVVMQWSAAHCPGARHVMKLDEDTFLDLPLLVDLLSEVSRRRPRYILGYRHHMNHPPVVRGGRWGVPREVYPFRKYPRYVIGPSYVITGNAVKDLVWAYMHMPLMINEDVYLTGLLAIAAGIRKLSCPRFAHNVNESPVCELVGGKSVSQTFFSPPNELFRMWNMIQYGCRCRH